MNKLSINKIFICARTGFVQWLINPKMFILAAVLFFFYSYAAVPLLELSTETNIKLNIFELFIALGNSGLILLIIPIVFMVIISDFPRLDSNTNFFILRIGKNNWLFAQFTQLFFMSLTFLVLFFIGTVILLMGKCAYDFKWSYIITAYVYSSPEKRSSFEYELLPENLYNQLTISETFLHTFLFTFLYLTLIGMIFIVSKVINKPVGGPLIAGAVIISGTILGAVKSKIMWIFPMANATIKLHYTRFLRKPIVSLSHSYLYFSILILMLALISVLLNKNSRYIN